MKVGSGDDSMIQSVVWVYAKYESEIEMVCEQ